MISHMQINKDGSRFSAVHFDLAIFEVLLSSSQHPPWQISVDCIRRNHLLAIHALGIH